MKNHGWRQVLSSYIGAAGSLRYRFATGTAWSSISTLLIRGFGLVGSIVVARLLGREKFGEYGIILSTVTTLAFVTSVSMSVTSAKFVAQYRNTDKIKAGRMIGLCWLSAFVFGMIAAGGLAGLSGWTSEFLFKAPHLSSILAWSSFIVLLGALTGVQNGMIVGLEAFKSMTVISLLNGFFYFVISIYFTWLWGLTGAVLALLISYFASWAANSFILRRAFSKAQIIPSIKGIWGERKALLNFSLPHMLASLLNFPVTWFCNALLVRQSGGMAQMGVYSAAYRWRELVLFIPGSLSPVAAAIHAERIGNHDRKSVSKLLWSSLLVVAVSAGLVACILALSSPLIMEQYGKEFMSDGVTVLILVAIGSFIEALTIPFSNLVTSAGRVWLSLAIGVVRSLVMLMSVYWLIGYGAKGLATAVIFSAGVSVFLLSFAVKSIIPKDNSTM